MKAIIINHNTRLTTLLSLLSVKKYTPYPILLIDCDSTDGSFEFFKSLKDRYDFELVQMPLQPHGKTLDHIFKETNEDALLLIDSDLEILNNAVIRFISEEMEKEYYGAGFLLKGHIITEPYFNGNSLAGAHYAERPFMPIVSLKTAPVKAALTAGISFMADSVNNEFTLLPKRFYWIAKKIFKKGFRKKYKGARPPKIIYDTGARMHEYLKKQGYEFSSLPYSNCSLYVTHYHGATRRVLNPNGNLVGAEVKNGMETAVLERLKHYEVSV